MRRAFAILTLASLCVLPAQADDKTTMEERLGDAFRQLLEDMRPSLEDALDETLEFFREFEAIDDLGYYNLPEVLPNGDIIIRRRPEAPEYTPRPPSDSDTVDL